MLNNKGFAVSTVLYTLLIAFLLFLGVTLAMFSSSNSIISSANKDLINGTKFEAVQVKTSDVCVTKKWYEPDIIVKVKSRYGTKYWPKDFTLSNGSEVEINGVNEGNVVKVYISPYSVSNDGKINVGAANLPGNFDLYELTFTDTVTGAETKVTIGDVCG